MKEEFIVLLKGIREEPDNLDLRRILADWLEEKGDFLSQEEKETGLCDDSDFASFIRVSLLLDSEDCPEHIHKCNGFQSKCMRCRLGGKFAYWVSNANHPFRWCKYNFRYTGAAYASKIENNFIEDNYTTNYPHSIAWWHNGLVVRVCCELDYILKNRLTVSPGLSTHPIRKIRFPDKTPGSILSNTGLDNQAIRFWILDQDKHSEKSFLPGELTSHIENHSLVSHRGQPVQIIHFLSIDDARTALSDAVLAWAREQ